jgi:hypothetical protein
VPTDSRAVGFQDQDISMAGNSPANKRPRLLDCSADVFRVSCDFGQPNDVRGIEGMFEAMSEPGM